MWHHIMYGHSTAQIPIYIWVSWRQPLAWMDSKAWVLASRAVVSTLATCPLHPTEGRTCIIICNIVIPVIHNQDLGFCFTRHSANIYLGTLPVWQSSNLQLYCPEKNWYHMMHSDWIHHLWVLLLQLWTLLNKCFLISRTRCSSNSVHVDSNCLVNCFSWYFSLSYCHKCFYDTHYNCYRYL